LAEKQHPLILVGVLDWGLGHAGRTIPVVKELQRQGAKVVLAGAGRAGILLQKECPDLPYLECPAYAVNYKGRNMFWAMFRQLPKIAAAILREHRWLRRIQGIYHFDAIISDSRFGCFHPSVPSVMVAHQLNLLLKPRWIFTIVNWFYRQLLRRFDEIWVPDHPNGLSGKLSTPSPFRNTRYLGWLSRMQPAAPAVKYELMVLLSGPEPQRSQLEEIILQQLSNDLPALSALLVQGKTEGHFKRRLANTNTEVISFLTGEELSRALAQARFVLCRAGYSSLMDLAVLQKPAILLPTPGQPEQEYLARHCADSGWAYITREEELDLKQAIREVKEKHYRIAPGYLDHTGRLSQVISTFLHALGK
jgi:predicted glycosyltransferase